MCTDLLYSALLSYSATARTVTIMCNEVFFVYLSLFASSALKPMRYTRTHELYNTCKIYSPFRISTLTTDWRHIPSIVQKYSSSIY